MELFEEIRRGYASGETIQGDWRRSLAPSHKVLSFEVRFLILLLHWKHGNAIFTAQSVDSNRSLCDHPRSK